MQAYIEYVGAVTLSRYPLDEYELRNIGEFTRENILGWLNSHTGPDWVGIIPVEDFCAVCGDIDIPWATEKAKADFQRVFPLGAAVGQSD